MILVVGGAGYIGSHLVKQLVKKERVVVFDNLSTGHREAIDEQAIFVHGDLNDRDALNRLFLAYPIKAVMHFAASSLVGESVQHPQKYYENNVVSTLHLLNCMLEHNVKTFIFSSTAAVYGKPNVRLIDETTPLKPINPYGRSKHMMEQVTMDYAHAYDMNYAILRYFNAAGADETAEIGESHEPETHLIPIILQHLLGIREKVSIYGTDYETVDGTCIRDYIHVTDLANAHIAALHSLLTENNQSAIYNVGNGQGYSVQEVVEQCEKMIGKKCAIEVVNRRPGDPARLVASSKKIEKELGWKAHRTLEQIIESAWKWHQDQKY